MKELESVRATNQSEENGNALSARTYGAEQLDRTLAVEKNNKNEEPENGHMMPNRHPQAKYTYGVDQWSPLNKNGKKAYDRDFLIQLRSNPNSRIKPLNLPDLLVVLKDNSKHNCDSMDSRPFIGGHDTYLLRGPLAVDRGSTLLPKPKTKKPAVKDVDTCNMEKHVLTSVIASMKSENTMERHRLPSCNASVEDSTAEALYTTVRQVLNKLMPHTFNTLVNQVKALRIDSNKKLHGIVDLVYEKAVKEPEFGEIYARMCKDLGTLEVSIPENEAAQEDSDVNFRTLIITRCVTEFEEAVDKNAKVIESREIKAIVVPGNEIQQISAGKERIARIKSFGNIRFIGELFKQGMLTSFIVHRCIRYLLLQIDDDSLECLSKLLSSVGKILESKDQKLESYFAQMMEIVSCKELANVSSRVRFMLQNVIELKMNKWIPKINRSTSNSMDQNLCQWSTNVTANTPEIRLPNKFTMLRTMNQDKSSPPPLSGSGSTVPRDHYDYGSPDYKSSFVATGFRVNTGGEKLVEDSAVARLVKNEHPMGVLQSSNDITLKNITADNVKTVTLNNEAHKEDKHSELPVSDTIPSDSTNLHSSDDKPSSASAAPPAKRLPILSKQKLIKRSADILERYLDDPSIDIAAVRVRETFDDCTFSIFVREVLSKVINRSVTARKLVTQLLMHLISTNVLPSYLYLSSLRDVLDASGDVAIDVSKIWAHLAELIWYSLAEDVHPFSELETMMVPLKKKGLAGTLMGEIMNILVREKSQEWVKDKWDESGLQWRDFLQENESLDDFIKKYKLEFLGTDKDRSSGRSDGQQLSMKQIHEQLHTLMSNVKENSFDNMCSWILANVGKRVSELEFIKVLMTAILEVSIEPYHDTWQFRVDKFHNLQDLILWYIDATINLSELQCLIAIQQYIHRLEDPHHALLQILEKQIFESILSVDVYHIWKNNKDLIHPTAKSVAMLAVKSFFTALSNNNIESIPNNTQSQVLYE